MEYIRVTDENLEKEHICCAISNNTDCQVVAKKTWIKQQLKEGLVFLKANVRGKCFIEYMPAENAWMPIEADGYMYINCFWVSGQLKGNGYANETIPRFKECVKNPKVPTNGYVLFYSHQCPFTAKYVPLLEQTAKEHGIPFKSILIDNKEAAQEMPVAPTTYALFYKGEFVTNEILSEKKFLKMCDI